MSGSCAFVPLADGSGCDDGQPCTGEDICKAGGCQPGADICGCQLSADCADREDDNLCNGTLYCDHGSVPATCKVNPATVVKCPDVDGGCIAPQCNPKSGACVDQPRADGTVCEDGKACTVGDACESGGCEAGAEVCQCLGHADCAAQDDGDLCNGSLYCDTNEFPYSCQVNPATVVTCDGGLDDACRKNLCEAASGECKFTDLPAGATCTDGDSCTQGDGCGGGKCVPGANVCVCESNDDCKSKEDGDSCNGTLYCDKLQSPPTCLINPQTVVVCNSGGDGTCKKNQCDKASGKCAMKTSANLSKCDDGDPCTVGDVCKSGTCSAGTDLCACKADADCLDDANACNGQPYCDTAATPPTCKTNPTTVVDCGDSKQGCKVPACDPDSGKCGLVADHKSCDDSNPCTVDVCAASGKCESGPQLDGMACGEAKVCHKGGCLALPEAMIYVPAGAATMGCNLALDAGCEADEKPQHEVVLPAFFMDRFEVTVDQYAACVNGGNCAAPSGGAGQCNWGQGTKGKHPINCISFDAAVAVCQHMGRRLPTEAEWEKAARGGCEIWGAKCASATPAYPWALAGANCSYAVMKGSKSAGCNLDSTLSVGSKAKDLSPYGLRDLGGNVSEWVTDGYDEDWYGKSPKQAPLAPPSTLRVVRGGSLLSDAAEVRAGNRQAFSDATQSAAIGVRCAADVPAKP